MYSRGTLRVDPQEPSTSTGPQRRREDNLRVFDAMFSKPQATTLWHVCTAHQRDPRAKLRYRLEIAELANVDFKELLYDHRYELNSLAKASGTNFKELFEALRFFSRFRKVPFFKSPDALELFKLVCNCVFHIKNRWVNGLNKDNLLNPDSLELVMKELKVSDSMRNSQERISTEFDLNAILSSPIATPKQESPQESPLPAPVSRLQDREKVPIPPPPTRLLYPGAYCVGEDEHLRDMHYYNYIRCYDTKFTTAYEKVSRKFLKYNEAVRSRTSDAKLPGARNSDTKTELEDYDYYQDNAKLTAAQLSFRLNYVVQIPNFDLPKSKADGYFPRECENRPRYVFEKYENANRDCKAHFAKIRDARPVLAGFKKSRLLEKECYAFHLEGRHIHGFFDVWEEEARGWKNPTDGQWVSRRYLVDIYNQLMFPLYVERNVWPESLRWAFDKYSCYGLKLWHMTKECSIQLRNAGEGLFSPYPPKVLDCAKFDFTSLKGRNLFTSSIQTENEWVVEQFLNALVVKDEMLREEEDEQHVEEDAVKPKRKRKGDPKMEEAMAASPAKLQRTPRKLSDPIKSPFSGPIVPVGMMHIQKENVERPQVATSVPSTPPRPYMFHNTTPPSTVKRRLTESEASLALVRPPPPKRKVSISLENWDDHRVQGAIREEHVDEREDDYMDEFLRQGVWVPQDRGEEVAPEVYAREILEHYTADSEPRDHPVTPPPPVKTARRRKTTPKNARGSPESTAPSVAPQPVMYSSKPTSSTSSAVSSVSVSSSATSEGISLPPSKATSGKSGLRLQYSMKPTPPPISTSTYLNNKYPVKQLPHGSPAPVLINGNRSVPPGTPSITGRITSFASQRAPYFSPQHRRAPHHPVVNHRYTNGIHSSSSTPSPSASTASLPGPQPPHRLPLHPQGPSMYRIAGPAAGPSNPEPPATSAKDPTAITPAKRAIANHHVTDSCRRVLPYAAVMDLHLKTRSPKNVVEYNSLHHDYKPNHPWRRKLMGVQPDVEASPAPPTAPAPLPPTPPPPPSTAPPPPAPRAPVIRRPPSYGTPAVDYRQRSFSSAARPANGVGPTVNFPPIAAPTAWPQSPAAAAVSASSSSAKERSVGLNKSRQERPWVANNRASVEPSPRVGMQQQQQQPASSSVVVNSTLRHPMAPTMVNQTPAPPAGHQVFPLPPIHPTPAATLIYQKTMVNPMVAATSRPLLTSTFPARVVPTVSTTTSAIPSRMTIPSSSAPPPPAGASDQQEMSIKELSTAIRKKCKTLTPEQHGDALRTHSRRFQVDHRVPSAPTPTQPPFVNLLSDNRS